MEELLKQILSKLDRMDSSINELKDGQLRLEERQTKLEEGQVRLEERQTKLESKIDRLEDKVEKMDDGQTYLFKRQFDYEVKMNEREDRFNNKIHKMLSYISNLVTSNEGFKQELPVLTARQIEHSNLLEDHEERIVKLEAG